MGTFSQRRRGGAERGARTRGTQVGGLGTENQQSGQKEKKRVIILLGRDCFHSITCEKMIMSGDLPTRGKKIGEGGLGGKFCISF